MVLRNSAWGIIKSKQIIPGDIVQIKKGDIVPADMVLITANLLKINNAIINGGNQSINRDVNDVQKCILDSGNVAFCGTTCTEGKGIGIVIRTGDSTVLGLIKDLANSVVKPSTQISADMKLVHRILTLPALLLGVLMLALGLSRK